MTKTSSNIWMRPSEGFLCTVELRSKGFQGTGRILRSIFPGPLKLGVNWLWGLLRYDFSQTPSSMSTLLGFQMMQLYKKNLPHCTWNFYDPNRTKSLLRWWLVFIMVYSRSFYRCYAPHLCRDFRGNLEWWLSSPSAQLHFLYFIRTESIRTSV